MSLPIEQLTPKQIVSELDNYIVGQDAAKKAVAVALRNRFRRQQLPEEDRNEITPKNILMIGPTGVGKTEIARRLAQLAKAPFVKIEATKFTEIGYVGRDVDSMIRDLASAAVRIVEKEMIEAARPEARPGAIDRLVDMVENIVGMEIEHVEGESLHEARLEKRKGLAAKIESGEYDDLLIDVETEEQGSSFLQVFGNQGIEEVGLDMNSMMPGFGKSNKTSSRKVRVGDALPFLIENQASNSIDQHNLHREALERAEQTGIIFIDEIDKVAMSSGQGGGPDVSRGGVQRDLLPVIEGATVQTKFGPLNTDHVLFIAAGAFHESKPSDLIPELQGRLPIRVELDSLGEDDLSRILKEPRNALTKQYSQLLAVDGVDVEFTDGALDEIAHMAAVVNEKTENIGARRLHTMVERLLEDLMFQAPEDAPDKVVVDPGFVREKLDTIVNDPDASRSVL